MHSFLVLGQLGKLNRRSKRASCVAQDGLLLLMKAVLRAVGAAMRMQRNARYYQQEAPADVTSMPRTAIKRSPSRSLMVIIEPKRVLKTRSSRVLHAQKVQQSVISWNLTSS